MNESGWTDLIELMRGARASAAFADGLSDAEVERAEENYGFRFPPDLRGLLQAALPNGFPFPDWRSGEDVRIRELLRLPLDGILVDVERNDFWLPEWGVRPVQDKDARAIVEEHVNQAPRLIPIYGHRMIPDRPHRIGNPVLSIHQTDIIYYGFDLDDYFRHEFGLPGRKPWPSEVPQVEFWDVDRWQDLRWR